MRPFVYYFTQPKFNFLVPYIGNLLYSPYSSIDRCQIVITAFNPLKTFVCFKAHGLYRLM